MKKLLCIICLLSLLISGCQDVSVNHPEASWGGFQISEDIPELQIVRQEEFGYDESKVIWVPISVRRKVK